MSTTTKYKDNLFIQIHLYQFLLYLPAIEVEIFTIISLNLLHFSVCGEKIIFKIFFNSKLNSVVSTRSESGRYLKTNEIEKEFLLNTINTSK